MMTLPALCAGLILAACTDGNTKNAAPETPPPASAVLTPGESEIEYGRISDTVTFQTDNSMLQPEAQRILQQQAVWLRDYPRHAVTIEGHADERGTREYNLALGDRRAQAVMNYLVVLGIDPKRVKTISFGKERPICNEANEACWSQNRRGVTTLDQ
jgi:peptidoglycan-associated lipoprotein